MAEVVDFEFVDEFDNVLAVYLLENVHFTEVQLTKLAHKLGF